MATDYSSVIKTLANNPYSNLADAFSSMSQQCCKSVRPTVGYKELKEQGLIMNKEDETMMNFGMDNMFNGLFGRVAPDMCRLTMSGKIAIKTSNGYKAYDVKKNRLTNCDNFVFSLGEDFFFVIPTNNVQRGDIILASGKPRCVLEVGKNEIKTFCYEDGTISTIVKERHVFMRKQYFYGKIVSLFGNFGDDSKGMDRMMKYMMISQMLKGSKDPRTDTTDFTSLMPMMFMMNGGNFFEGMFDFSDVDDEDGDESGDDDE